MSEKAKLMRRREFASTYPLPKSLCSCGHTGDGPLSAHIDDLEFGHGRCRICDCTRFAWSSFTMSFQEDLDNA